MAIMKRKRDSDAEPRKTSKKPHLAVAAAATLVKQPREQDTAFVRGGASVLTPLENRQIRAQVNQEILFEEEGARKSKRRPALKDADPYQDRSAVIKSHAKANGRGRHAFAAPQTKAKDPPTRIEGLSYKRLVKGLRVLGRVCEIGETDIGLSLPNNLTGYVPISFASNALRQELLDSTDVPQEKQDARPKTIPTPRVSLSSRFHLGQYLRAAVITSSGTNGAHPSGRKHIELSLLPEDANAGFTTTDLVIGSVLQAEVASVEDHGLTMHLALGDSSPMAFLPFSDLGAQEGAGPPRVGAVLLCMVIKVRSNGRVIEVTADTARMGNMSGKNFLKNAPTIGALLPGTAVEFVVSNVSASALTGQMMNMVTVTADVFHSGGALSGKLLNERIHKGDKVKGRIICSASPSTPVKILISLLEHVLHLSGLYQKNAEVSLEKKTRAVVSTIQSGVSVDRVEPGLGVFMSLAKDLPRAFAHISRLSDTRVETISPTDGPFAAGTQHEARVLSFNLMDGLFNLSLEPQILAKPFLSIGDINVGSFLQGSIDKQDLDASGIRALFLDLGEGVRGFVERIHFADMPLKNPERKLREGKAVRGRVLAVDRQRRKVQLTLKKSLLDESIFVLKSYEEASEGTRALGTIVNVSDAGALVQFFGGVRGFLPVQHYAEQYAADSSRQLHAGQSIKVTVESVKPELERMTVSCRVGGAPSSKREALQKLRPGVAVEATVIGKTNSNLILVLKDSQIQADIPISHLCDGVPDSEGDAANVDVGQLLTSAVVLGRDFTGLKAILTCKSSLIQAFSATKIPASMTDVKPGADLVGFVKNFSSFGIFVEFADGLTGLLPKNHLDSDASSEAGFGYMVGQVIPVTVLGIDAARSRFVLTGRPLFAPGQARKGSIMAVSASAEEKHKILHEFGVGVLTLARVVSVKQTQVNVELAGGAPGRVDSSAAFDSPGDIKDPKHPLKSFRRGQHVAVRILGVHDTRNHRFLPITHRGGATVFELSAKPTDQTHVDSSVLSVSQISIGQMVPCFVNNIDENWLWVNLSPSVSGRIRLLDASDDMEVLVDVHKHIPLGSVLTARVLAVDLQSSKVELSAGQEPTRATLSFGDLSAGNILPARVTKVTSKQVLVQLSDNVFAPIQLTDLEDDFSKANPEAFHKNRIMRVCITELDADNQRLSLSARPSRVLSSHGPVRDREVTACDQLVVGELVRGFIKLLTDKGLLVALATSVTAFVRISDLSDEYLKDWKALYEPGQLVEGKVLHIDSAVNQIRLSLKRSHVDAEYKAPSTYADYNPGQIVSGKVRKVESFGIFVVLDNSCNVSGLCHRSELSDEAVNDARTLFEEGDNVKAKILTIDLAKRRMALGLKAAYFVDADGSGLTDASPAPPTAFDPDLAMTNGAHEGGKAESAGMRNRLLPFGLDPWPREDEGEVLKVADFEWDPAANALTNTAAAPTDTGDGHTRAKRKRGKATDQGDQTANLDAEGPRNEADYERLLMSQPNSSILWLGYIALYLERDRVDKARQVADRATRTINNQSTNFSQEVLDMWVAYLNLENTYGDPESLNKVFEQACGCNDTQQVYEHLVSIYIRSGQPAKAEELLQTMTKKFSVDIKVWLNYASFLYNTLSAPQRARALLSRALQVLPTYTHIEVTSKFAQLEFRAACGDVERGRTMFEGLLGTFPKRTDLWNVYLDREIAAGSVEQARLLFSRVTKLPLKPRKAKFFFQKWLDLEEKHGDDKRVEQVKAKAAEFVRNEVAKA